MNDLIEKIALYISIKEQEARDYKRFEELRQFAFKVVGYALPGMDTSKKDEKDVSKNVEVDEINERSEKIK